MYRVRNCAVLNLQIPARQVIESVSEIGLLTGRCPSLYPAYHTQTRSIRFETRVGNADLSLLVTTYFDTLFALRLLAHPLLLEWPLLVYITPQWKKSPGFIRFPLFPLIFRNS